jgi:hypothetical protein
MSRNRRKSESRKDEFKPTTAETVGNAQFFVRYVIGKITWPVWVLLIALPLAGYFAQPYYEAWAVWDSTFETQVFNMNDERIGNMLSTQYDEHLRIGSAGAHPNSMSNAPDDYTNSRKITLYWNFMTRDHGHTRIEPHDKNMCYYKTLELPERKKGLDYLQIGVYDKNVLRVRWSANRWVGSDVGNGKYTAADAWRHGNVPLSSNWRKDDPTNWPEKTTWNEAVDGPAIDLKGEGAWITLKADYSKPCEE